MQNLGSNSYCLILAHNSHNNSIRSLSNYDAITLTELNTAYPADIIEYARTQRGKTEKHPYQTTYIIVESVIKIYRYVRKETGVGGGKVLKTGQ